MFSCVDTVFLLNQMSVNNIIQYEHSVFMHITVILIYPGEIFCYSKTYIFLKNYILSVRAELWAEFKSEFCVFLFIFVTTDQL